MQIWLVTNNRRERISLFTVWAWVFTLFVALGAGIALAVMFTLPIYVRKAWDATYAASVEVHKCQIEIAAQRQDMRDLAQAASVNSETCGRIARGIGGN